MVAKTVSGSSETFAFPKMAKICILVVVVILSSVEANISTNSSNFAASQLVFSANTYKELAASQPGNLIMSPLSARLVLALTREGAKGKTKKELSKGLQLQENGNNTHRSIGLVVDMFNKSNEKVKLLSANKLYLAKDFHIKKRFEGNAVDVYKSDIQKVDFAQSAEAAHIINRWVEDNTNERIKNLISPNQIDETTKLVLVNALYFSGKWQHPFHLWNTRPRSFYISKTDSKSVDMMNSELSAKYAYNDRLKAKFLKLAFQQTSVSMTFILPDEVDGLLALEEKLKDCLARQDFKDAEVNVTLPKFSIETTIDFKPLLQNLGIKKVFDPSQAELTGISQDGGLYVDLVVQKAFINVTEDGAEAAAATLDGITNYALHIPPQPGAVFRADHPFLYYIKDESSDIIIFIGKYAVV